MSWQFLSTAEDDGWLFHLMGEDDGSAKVLIYRPGAITTRYTVRLNPDELVDLAVSALAHVHRCNVILGVLS